MLPFVSTLGDDKQQASGYHHTYLKNNSINLSGLVVFPSNEEIQSMIDLGFQEAHCLWKQLGFILPISNPLIQILPPINTCTQHQHTTFEQTLCGPNPSEDEYRFQDLEEPNDEQDDSESEYSWLISSLEGHQQKAGISSCLENMLSGVACASISLDVEQLRAM